MIRTATLLARCGIAALSLGLPLYAQVSPGQLSKSHHFLDSPLKCTSCHVFGVGKPKLICQYCHKPIRALIAEKRGFHGLHVNRAKGDVDCARCHTEHYGADFNIKPWPKSKEEFDHREAGYPLVGKHAGLRCEKCHTPSHISATERKKLGARDLNQTFLGLTTACLTCHEDQHAGQLGRDCQRCHDVTGWKPLHGFDHAATHFPLTGKHVETPCAKCHRPLPSNPKVVQYTGLKFAECSGCHQDPHHGAFAARCETCHNTNAWKRVERLASAFNHAKTHFPLLGKHTEVPCLKCHKDANFKTPIPHAKCMDCHRDPHKGQFQHRTTGLECAPCHNEKGFKPSLFSAADHSTTGFPLLGKHQKVECAKCHKPAGADTNYHPAFKACGDCHTDPHRGQFAGAPHNNRCEECHTVDAFQPSTFTLARHQSTAFPLKGAHDAVACMDCHRTETGPGRPDRRFHFPTVTCQRCHQDPHHGEFPATLKAGLKPGQDVCERCHTVVSWRELLPFDHSTTSFALAGAHRAITCLDCHRPPAEQPKERRIPFKGAPERCAGCHEDVHAGQFNRNGQPADCSTCHNPARWAAAAFDHNKGTNFPLTGAHANVPCRLCHFQRRVVDGRNILIYKGTKTECAACHRK